MAQGQAEKWYKEIKRRGEVAGQAQRTGQLVGRLELEGTQRASSVEEHVTRDGAPPLGG